MKEKQTTQSPKEKIQKDKQRSTKHTHETKDRVTRTPLKIGGELRCSGRVHSPCSTSGTIPEGFAVPALET
jgi:hypothetical protein